MTEYIPAILYEDNHAIVVDKPAGMLTQGDASGAVSLLVHIRQYLKRRECKPGNVYLGMVQRLDKPVSGVILFAKTSKAAGRISEQIRNRLVLKYYVAVTTAGSGKPHGDGQVDDMGWVEVRHHLLRIGSKTVAADASRPGAQRAVLKLKTVFANDVFRVHLIRLVTGRKHQIRAQLAALRMPICGDLKYGSNRELRHGRILLHACLLSFVHPTRSTEVEVCSPAPAYFFTRFTRTEQEQIRSRLLESSGCRETSVR